MLQHNLLLLTLCVVHAQPATAYQPPQLTSASSRSHGGQFNPFVLASFPNLLPIVIIINLFDIQKMTLEKQRIINSDDEKNGMFQISKISNHF